MHKIKPGATDDFTAQSQADILATATQVTGVLTVFLGAIAGISLVVGGIGIMNIMLVSVTERTREIGLRKAVGARRSDILYQFLVETITLSVLGGIIGILLGAGISALVNASGAIATQVSAAVGGVGLWLLGGDRYLLRDLPGQSGGGPEADRSAALRIRSTWAMEAETEMETQTSNEPTTAPGTPAKKSRKGWWVVVGVAAVVALVVLVGGALVSGVLATSGRGGLFNAA